jgi:hypothetical protein
VSGYIVSETREWEADVDALRAAFSTDLAEDGCDLDSDEAVISWCFEQGVREPYFELDNADSEVLPSTGASGATQKA